MTHPEAIPVQQSLAPCPFCGGEANGDGVARYSPPLANTWWNDGSKITEAFFVNCISCGVRNGTSLGVGYQTREKAHEHWNTRASAGAVPAGMAKPVRDALEFAGDIRWQELSEGSPFTVIDRQLLGELHRVARSKAVVDALSAAPDATPSAPTAPDAISATAAGKETIERTKAAREMLDLRKRARAYLYEGGEGSALGFLKALVPPALTDQEKLEAIFDFCEEAAPTAPQSAGVSDEAADLLGQYAEFIRNDVKADDLERHPYLPRIEQAIEDLRALTPTPADRAS